MGNIKRGLYNLLYNRLQFFDSIVSNFLKFLPDKLYLSLRYRCKMGQWINWDNPKTFSEKLQWLKVYNRKHEHTMMVDKYSVKKYVADLIGEEHVIPTLGVWDTTEDIQWDLLPDQFVLKTTQGVGSGGVVICRDKSAFDKDEATKALNISLKHDIYSLLREWPYKNVRSRIIAEKYIAPDNSGLASDLSDYKFFCFNGEPLYCQVIRDRSVEETIDFYDMDWNQMDFIGLVPMRKGEWDSSIKRGNTPVVCPENLDNLKDICRKLAKGIPFIRVDLYVVGSNAYFGELTFFPASGMGTFEPEVWQYKLGELIVLPTSM